MLVGGAAQVQGQLRGPLRFGELADHLLQPVAEGGVVTLQAGGGEALAQLPFQLRAAVAEQQRADPLALLASSNWPSGQAARV